MSFSLVPRLLLICKVRNGVYLVDITSTTTSRTRYLIEEEWRFSNLYRTPAGNLTHFHCLLQQKCLWYIFTHSVCLELMVTFWMVHSNYPPFCCTWVYIFIHFFYWKLGPWNALVYLVAPSQCGFIQKLPHRGIGCKNWLLFSSSHFT